MHRRADILTARALRHGLDSDPTVEAVVLELVELARGDCGLLQVALTRIERGLADRSSHVGERAREALERALILTTAGPCSAPVLGPFGPGSRITTETGLVETADHFAGDRSGCLAAGVTPDW